jgi:Domain of unknown function (DUF4265)
MAHTNDNHVKIHHLFYSDTLEEDIVEKMWAISIDRDKGLYKLDSIPFYSKSLAIGDIIQAKYDSEEKALVLEDIIEFSGHSTVQVVIMNDTTSTEDVRTIFHKQGCSTEKQMDRYFAIDIPKDIHYKPIKEKLLELESQGIISYGEACLSEQHRM